jgi:hypothetical protein
MSELDPAVVDVFNSLVDERGGAKAFNSFQAECVLAIAQSMIDVHDAGAIERARIMEAVGRMMLHLPPVPARKLGRNPNRITETMTAAEACLMYQRTLGDPHAGAYDDDGEPFIVPAPAQRVPPSVPPIQDATATRPEPKASLEAALGVRGWQCPNGHRWDAAGDDILAMRCPNCGQTPVTGTPQRADLPQRQPDIFTPPRRDWRPGQLPITEEILRKAGERPGMSPDEFNRASGFADMRSMLRSQGWR